MSVRAQVTLKAYPMWRLRLRRGLPRYLLVAVSAFGVLASARFAIAPPRSQGSPATSEPKPAPDLGAGAYAVQFTRRYLSWSGDGTTPATGAEGASRGDSETEAVVPGGVEQHVLWAEVVQAREPITGEHVYTVAAQTDSAGLLYLTVSVSRLADGVLALAGFPAFVGPPASLPAPTPPKEATVNEPALEVVLRRALANYLSDSGSELAADLAPGAQVSLPSNALTVDSTEPPDLGHRGSRADRRTGA